MEEKSRRWAEGLAQWRREENGQFIKSIWVQEKEKEVQEEAADLANKDILRPTVPNMLFALSF